MAPRSTLDASKLVLTTGAGCLVFARAHLGFVPWEFVPSVFSAFGSSIWGTSTGRSSTLTDLAFCTRTVLTTRTTRSATGQSTSGRCQSCRSCWAVVSWCCGAPAVSRPASASRSGWFSLRLMCELWQQLGLDEFWRQRLPEAREAVSWEKVLQLQVVNCLLDPGSDFRLHRQWYVDTAMDELLETDFAVAAKDRLYRCLDDMQSLFKSRSRRPAPWSWGERPL